jgi:aldehyde:ferredoxin oxidoreductase
MNGYMGKLLAVDLTTGQLQDEPVDPEIAADFVGGAGYAARYLYDQMGPETDPLGPNNVLMFMTGPLVGTRAPSCGRHEICALSPLTGIWGESSSGGFWGTELRRAGYDGLVIRGRAPQPVWLSLVEGQPPALHDATGLWGLDTYQTQQRLRDELADDKVRVASIGPAGENQVLYAAVMNDHGRAAGRTGMGAVMGSKNLKAIAVRGRQRVPLADPDAFGHVAKEALQVVLDDFSTRVYRELGTASFVHLSMMWGNMPNKYWSQPEFEDAADLSGPSMAETILERGVPCYGCAVACGREVRLAGTGYGGDRTLLEGGVVDGPEYETVAMLGSMLLVSDLPGVAYAGHLCNRYGLDTISAGSAISLAYLLYDRGILTPGDTGGLPLEWGNIETALTLLEMITRRQGLGDLLAQGAERFAAHYGAPDLAVHVNGLDLPAHDPRAVSGMGLAYATSPRGACHMQGDVYIVELGLTLAEAGIEPGSSRFVSQGRAPVVANLQDWRTLYNSAIMCIFVNPTAPLLAQLLSAATGGPPEVQWWQRAGERIFQLKRAFNNRLGVRRGNDRLPERLLLPMANGTEGHRPRMDILLDEYYQHRDWDWQTGRPSPKRLEALGLGDVAEDLWSAA